MRIKIKRRHEHFERFIFVNAGRRNEPKNRFEKRRQITPYFFGIVIPRHARSSDCIDDRKIQMALVMRQMQKQFFRFAQHFRRPRIFAVDFVNNDDNFQIVLQCLLQHKLRLRQRAFGRVDYQKRAVRHVDDALHFAGKIRMPGGINDVDLRTFIKNGGVFR